MKNFSVEDFRFALLDDVYNEQYISPNVWSRPYEYEYVINFIKSKRNEHPKNLKIHNTSWGFEGVHVVFRDNLDKIGECVHSDIVSSKVRNTYYYDILTENDRFKNNFDYVINVSTIEHLSLTSDRMLAINNLFKQVKIGGYLILTFDYPRVNLNEIELLVNKKCVIGKNVLNGNNSINKNEKYKDLNIVYLILQKNG